MRPELETAQALAWDRLAQPGTWWTAAERRAIAAECRASRGCALCGERAAALSPSAIPGDHRRASPTLPDAAIEAIHRIATDPGRIGESWFLRLRAQGLADAAYTELVSVVAVVTAVDTYRRAAGLPERPLPNPEPGRPLQRLPSGARPGLGFVPTLAPEDRGPDDPDLYRSGARYGANIHRALSMVPDSMIHWWDLMEDFYQSSGQMRDFGRDYRAIGHAQIELIAARVAAPNRCEY